MTDTRNTYDMVCFTSRFVNHNENIVNPGRAFILEIKMNLHKNNFYILNDQLINIKLMKIEINVYFAQLIVGKNVKNTMLIKCGPFIRQCWKNNQLINLYTQSLV